MAVFCISIVVLGLTTTASAAVQDGEMRPFVEEDTMFFLEGYGGTSFKQAFAEPDIESIFRWFVPMYGGLLVLWIILRLSPVLSKNESYHIVLLCITWAAMSIGMNVLNKSLILLLGAPTLVAAAQMIVAAVVMAFAWALERPAVKMDQLAYWLFVPGVFAGVLITSFMTMEYISLTLLTLVRNSTPMVVLPLECCFMPPENRPWVSPGAAAAILVMFVGAVMYGGSVPNVSMLGLGFAILNMVMAVTDRLVQRRLLSMECKDLPLKVCTAMKNGVGLLPTMLVAFISNEIKHMDKPEVQAAWSDPRTMVLLLMSSCVGIGICYSGLACQRAISATSFVIMQNLCKVLVVGAGICLFGDPINSPYSVAGIVLSILGSLWYGKIQSRAAAASERQPLLKNQAPKQ